MEPQRLEVWLARILIVDWEEVERVYLWEVLEKAGHELLFAADGQTALQIWRTNRIDLIITELYLPELNGLRLIREITDRDARARIVAISAISADQLDMAEDYGACRILCKPATPDRLLAAVEEGLKEYRPERRDVWK
jgi:CheY-like chemotaxis protein